jgi:LPXTG-motif cell wall-anchored protein
VLQVLWVFSLLGFILLVGGGFGYRRRGRRSF